MNKMLKFGLMIVVLLLLTACGADESDTASVEGEIAPPGRAI